MSANCGGKRTQRTGPCGSPLYRCKKCGNAGCAPGLKAGECSSQGFLGGNGQGKCVKCGTSGQLERV